MMKKVVTALLTIAMVFSMTACGSGKEESGSSESTAGTESQATTDSKDTTGADTTDDTTTEALAAEPVVLIGGDNAGVGAAAQLYGELFSKRIEEISGGLITVNYQPNGALGSDTDQQQQMLDGDMDFVICQTAQTTGFVPEVAIFDLPMVFAKYDAEKIGHVLNESAFAEALSACYEAKGMKVLHFLQGGTFRETTTNREIRTLEDFSGLQIRTMENSNHMAFWSALGANPTPLTWGEVYITLQNGGLDAQENATDTCVGANLQEVQDYLVRTHHILYCNQLLFNAEKFNSMPEQYQQWLVQAAKEAATEIETQLAELDRKSTETLVAGGMEEVVLDEAFVDEVLAVPAVQELYKAIDNQVGGGLVTLLQEELAK